MKPVVFLAFSVLCLIGVKTEDEDRIPWRTWRRNTISRFNSKAVGYRLPRHLLPDNYEIQLLPFLTEGNFTIDGLVKITFDCYEASDNLTLHYRDMNIEQPVVAELGGAPLTVLEWQTHDEETDQVVITVDPGFEAGKRYTVEIKYLANLNALGVGFYRSSYVNAEGQTRWQAATQFESTDARRAFPSFDEPNMKATFTVTLGRTPDYTTLANGEIAELGVPHATDSNFVWDKYQKTPVRMSTYLVAFLVSDFAKFPGRPTNTGTPVAHYGAPTYTASQADLGLEVTPTIMEFFQDFTGFDYPMPKMDQVAVPFFLSGAMENWGLITYQEYLLFWDGPLKHAASAEQNVVGVIAHELSHQWFGDLVTCDWWSVIWLNEGLTTYMENLAMGAARPNWPQEQMFVIDYKQYVMRGPDSLETSRPMYVPVDSNYEADAVFDSIAYDKSGSVVFMVEEFLGKDVLQDGLRKYLEANQYSNAEMPDLFAAWQAAADEAGVVLGASVQDIMDTWTLQINYPLVTVTRQYGSGSASIQQERYLRPPYPRAAEPYYWWIPLTYTQDYTETKQTWHPNTPEPVTISGLDDIQPVIFNVRAKGYYRVNYDAQNWQQIVELLASSPATVDIMARSQLIDDTLNLAKDGHLGYDTALAITRFLAAENEWMPWEAFDNNIAFLDNLLASRLAYADFGPYLLRLVKFLYETVTFTDSVSDDLITLYKRIIAVRWACKFGNADCVSNVRSLYATWMANGGTDSSFISPNQKSAVFCNAIRYGDLAEFDFALNVFSTQSGSPDRSNIFSGLACTRDPILIDKLLEWSITDPSIIPKTSASALYTNLATNPLGRNQAFIFLRDNFDAANAYFGVSTVATNGIVAVSRYFTQESEVNELIAFRDAHLDQPLVVAALTPAIERAQANLVWATNNYQVIADWLTNEIIGGK